MIPELGHIQLAAIRPSDLRGVVDAAKAKGLAPKTVKHAYTVAVQLLRDAAEDGAITRVPTPPRRQRRQLLPPVPKKEQRYLTADEVERLAEMIEPRYRAFVYLGSYGALRYGELAALRVQNVKVLERRVLVVESGEGTEPKWGSAGPVDIPAFVADELAHHLGTYGAAPRGHVFTSPDGQRLAYPNFFRRVWTPAINAAGVAPFRIHDMRHTAVALSILAGAHPAKIRELCRHRSITTTLGIYGHLFESLHGDLAERLNVMAVGARDARDAGRGRDVEVVPLRSERGA